MDFVTIIGLVAATCTTVSFIPQVVKIVKMKETRDISLLTFLLLELGIFLWLVYGIYLANLPIILANAVTLLLTTVVIGLKLKYG
ncbi:MAG: SemiSWEET transporter [Proteobacteria bacterium]|nr:SemiSWEET transporter [Pseudomonadota bacterium]